MFYSSNILRYVQRAKVVREKERVQLEEKVDASKKAIAEVSFFFLIFSTILYLICTKS